MVVMARLFKSFDNQDRLAVVTRTLTGAASDMFHFFIVFFAVYFCMTVNSVLLFGQDVQDFATLDRAINTCFRMMFGDWSWNDIKGVNKYRPGRAEAASLMVGRASHLLLLHHQQ